MSGVMMPEMKRRITSMVRKISLKTAVQVINDDDGTCTFGQGSVDHMTANEARSTGDKNSLTF